MTIDLLPLAMPGGDIVYAGAGGGGGKKGGGRKPEEDAESLRSRSEAIFVAVLSEGEVQGFEAGVDPLTRIFLDGVPIKNRDGSFNYTINAFYTGSSVNALGKGSLIPAISASLPSLIRNNVTGAVNSIVVDYRVGTQSQAPMPGFDDIKAEQGVGIKITKLIGAVSRVTTSSL